MQNTFQQPFQGNIDKPALAWPSKKYQSLKTEIRFKFPNTLQVKSDKCEKHGEFGNEQVGLPSGKQVWLGCSICRQKLRENAAYKAVQEDMLERNMKLENGKWVFNEAAAVVKAHKQSVANPPSFYEKD